MRSLMVEILSISGHQVWTAASGEEAIWKFREVHPDLILLDISMPGMNGYDVLRALRECPGGDKAKVVMMTALGDPKAVQVALELGARDYFIKGNIEIDHLLERVDQHVQSTS
jgi:two-component system chemotaxis response regulator CheY